jgi:capsular exopolysaccharide synthesis family protein
LSTNEEKKQLSARNGRPVFKPNAGADARNEITVAELREIIARRRVPLLFCAAVGLAIAVTFSLLSPSKFEASSRLSINYHGATSSGAEMLAQATGAADPTTLETQVSILQTDSLAWDVIKQLRLDQRREALPREFGVGPVLCQSVPDESVDAIGSECRERILQEFHKRLHVQVVPRTEIVEIRHRSESRLIAAQVVDALASLYIDRVFQFEYQSATRNSTWLAGELDNVKKDAESSARRLIAHEELTGSNDMDGGVNLVLARMSDLSQQLISTQSDRIVKGARYQIALSGEPEGQVGMTQGSPLQLLHSQVLSLENQYAELNAKFGESYPAVIQVKEQLAKAREALQAEQAETTKKLKDDYETSVKSEDVMRAELEDQQKAISGSTEDWVQMALLNREMEASGELYKQVVKRLKTGGLLAADNGPDITVIDPASVSFRRAEPRTAINALIGMLIGLVCGLALSGLLERFDRRIETSNDVAELCPVSGVGIIPCVRRDGRDALPAVRSGHAISEAELLDGISGEAADAFRSLRTSLLHANASGAPRLVLVTSALSHEGASAVSSNLAVAFARMNHHVLLIDADLRREASKSAQTPDQAAGLAAALRGTDYRSCASVASDLKNLTYLPAGARVANSPDLFDSARMREMVAQWREEYDEVIVNLPRLISQSDAVILSTMVDAVLLAVRAGQARRKDVLSAMGILESAGARLHGAVVTDVRSRNFFSRMASWHNHTFNGGRMENVNDAL